MKSDTKAMLADVFTKDSDPSDTIKDVLEHGRIDLENKAEW